MMHEHLRRITNGGQIVPPIPVLEPLQVSEYFGSGYLLTFFIPRPEPQRLQAGAQPGQLPLRRHEDRLR